MKQFKVEFNRSGVVYSPEYVTTLRAAVKKAQSKGWNDRKTSYSTTPDSAEIFERVAGTYGSQTLWEFVARVSANGLWIEDPEDRESVKQLRKQIEECTNGANAAYTTQQELVAIANKQFAESQKKR